MPRPVVLGPTAGRVIGSECLECWITEHTTGFHPGSFPDGWFSSSLLSVLIARWTDYSPLAQFVFAYVTMDGVALVFLVLCDTVDALRFLGEEFSVVWDAPYFAAISKYLGLTSFNRREEWTGEEGGDVVSRFRRKEIADYLNQQD